MLHTLTCKECGKEFKKRDKRRKFCSDKCKIEQRARKRREAHSVLRQCANPDCDTTFWVNKKSKRPRRFCCKTCSGETNAQPQGNEEWQKLTRESRQTAIARSMKLYEARVGYWEMAVPDPYDPDRVREYDKWRQHHAG